ncbi:MAG TPA: L,D-transpeptidase [Ktedonobacterales bacterium]
MNNFDAGMPSAPKEPARWRRWIAPAQGALGPRKTGLRRWIIPGSVGVIALLLLGVALNGVAIYLTHSALQRDQNTLNNALASARSQYNVPPSRLAPIAAAERQAVAATDGTFPSYQRADTAVVRLTRQVNALAHTDPAPARQMTQTDLAALAAGVDTLTKAGFTEATGFQKRLAQAQTQFSAATTTPQIFAVDTYALDQLTAVNAFQPTYKRLQDFTSFINTESQLINNGAPVATATSDLQCAQGLTDTFWLDDPSVQVKNTSNAGAIALAEAAWPAADLAQLRAAASSADFAALNSALTSQTQQALANESSLLPGVTNNLLTQFQSDITLMQQQKQDTTTYEQLYAQDKQQAQTVAATPSVAGYTALVTALRKHLDQIGLPLIKAKTKSDVAAFNQLLAQGLAMKTVDPANGVAYSDAYEYADPNTGIGDATQRLASAQTAHDYQLVDNEVLMFTANLQAMIQDTKDPSFNILDPNNPKAYWKVPHQTDLNLINYYGLGSTKVIVVSFVEQAARLYDNGTLVRGFKVTTGAPDLPSVPGLHCGLDHLKDTVFKSPDPPGSPNYYLPTPIHFAVDYSYYGYALHDAWWRSWFGRYSNLPHYDPAAFNGGSHGCINFAYYNGDAQYMWNFVQQGTPIIVY